jgi:prevent-host-death family protein
MSESAKPDTLKTSSDARLRFGEIMSEAIAGRRTVITRNGRPVAILIPYPKDSSVQHDPKGDRNA